MKRIVKIPSDIEISPFNIQTVHSILKTPDIGQRLKRLGVE
jgi:hypothetical protein